MKPSFALIVVVYLWTLASRAADRPAPVLADPSASLLFRAHAHNDYEHARPLFDALDHKFCSVEADIYLVGGRLLVAHNRDQVTAERSLQTLYLDPLRERSRKNGGRVYPGGPSLTLLIDVKSDADPTYSALRKVLGDYRDMLTLFGADRVETNAVTVIISGNRAREMMAEEKLRYAALDGRLEDLDTPASSSFIPLISDNWTKMFNWRGEGPIPEAEKLKLKELVAKAHQQGRRVRFWATPERPTLWRQLIDGGVDLISTDDLAGLQDFFSQGIRK